MKLHQPQEAEEREYVGVEEARKRFMAMLEPRPELRVKGTWRERVEREAEERGR